MEGKNRSKNNAWKGGEQPRVLQLTQVMRLFERTMANLKRDLKVNSSFCRKPFRRHRPASREEFRGSARLPRGPLVCSAVLTVHEDQKGWGQENENSIKGEVRDCSF